MKITNLILIILFFFQLSCGYKIANNLNDYKFKVSDYKLQGDKKINNILDRNFKRLNYINDYSKTFELNLTSEVKSSIIAKDTSGNALAYRLKITIELEVFENKNFVNKILFSEETDYNNNDSKFELKQYEDILTQDITDQIITKINNYLSSIK